LTAAEWARAQQAPVNRLDAWDQYRRGTWHLYRFDRDNIFTARDYCLAAMARDPNFAEPCAAFAYTCHLTLIFDYAADRERTLREGLDAARNAVQLDDRDSFAHAILGRLHMMARDYDLAIAETQTAIERNPYSPQAYFGLGFALVVAGRSKEALLPLLKAVELSPRDPNLASYGTVLATAHLISSSIPHRARFPLARKGQGTVLLAAFLSTRRSCRSADEREAANHWVSSASGM